MLLVEDCALSLLSEPGGRAARHASATGRCSASTRRCRCRTASLLVQNTMPLGGARSPEPAACRRRVGARPRRRARGAARARPDQQRRHGAAVRQTRRRPRRGRVEVDRANVGDIGFNLDDVDLAMSSTSRAAAAALRLRRHSAPARRATTRRCATALHGYVTPLHSRARRRRLPAVLPDRGRRQAGHGSRSRAARRGSARVLEPRRRRHCRRDAPTSSSCDRTCSRCPFTRISPRASCITWPIA